MTRKAERSDTQVNALVRRVTTVYDVAGNVLRTIDAAGKTTTYTYDNLNRQVTVQAPGLGMVTTVYDAGDNVVNTIDGLGHKVTMAYDELGRKTKDVDALGNTTTYLYDLAGNRTGLIDPDGNRTTFVYDNQDRLTQQTDPLGHSVTMAYDKANRLLSRTDRRGGRVDRVYDLLVGGSLVDTETWWSPGGAVINTLTHTYDEDGNVLVARDSFSAYTMTYDALNRVSTVKDQFGLTLTYSYDAAGNRAKLEDSKGGVTTSVFNAVDLLTSRQFGGAGQTPLRFDTAYTSRNLVGTVTRYSDLAGSTKVGESDYAYDDGGRATNIQHKNGSGTVLTNLTYTYDGAGRLWTDKVDGALRTYAYDSADQVTSDGSRAFTYDGAGNRNMSGYTTGAGNRVSSDGAWTYTYDADGELVERTKGPLAETWELAYHNGELIQIEKRANGGGGTLLLKLVYQYDAYGRRIEEDRGDWTQNPATTVVLRFGYDGDDVLMDLDGSNGLKARYVRPDGTDALGARVVSGAAGWYLTDRQGSVVGLTNGTGVLQGTLSYSSFGTSLSDTTGSFGDRYKYAGREYQGDIQWYYNRARWYNPDAGRWFTEDPSGFGAGDYNLYRYGYNSPTNATDPSGLDIVWVSNGKGDSPKAEFSENYGDHFRIKVCPHTVYENETRKKKTEDSMYIDCAGKDAGKVSFVQIFWASLKVVRRTKAGLESFVEVGKWIPQDNHWIYEIDPKTKQPKEVSTGVNYLDAHKNEARKVGYVESGFRGGISANDAWMVDTPDPSNTARFWWNDSAKGKFPGYYKQDDVEGILVIRYFRTYVLYEKKAVYLVQWAVDANVFRAFQPGRFEGEDLPKRKSDYLGTKKRADFVDSAQFKNDKKLALGNME